MLTSLDHIRLRSRDVAKSLADYEALFGRGSRDGAAISVGTTGLDVRASADAESTEGVEALVFATDSLDALQEHLQARGVAASLTADASGRLVLDAEATRGIALEVVGASPRAARAAQGEDVAERLDHAVVITSAHEQALALYGEILGMRLALDRTFEQRGVRILFFRLGGVTVEVAGPIAARAENADAPDHFGGLAWRGRDLIAWRERLLAQGFNVSDLRKGHKAGTRVCTVGDRTAGVPTLLIGEDVGSASD